MAKSGAYLLVAMAACIAVFIAKTPAGAMVFVTIEAIAGILCVWCYLKEVGQIK